MNDTSAIGSAVRHAGGQARLAESLGITPGAISQMVSGMRPIPTDRCPAIERATEGRVTCEELRPDIRWHRIPDPTWPHAEGRPAIDVAAPAAQEAA